MLQITQNDPSVLPEVTPARWPARWTRPAPDVYRLDRRGSVRVEAEGEYALTFRGADGLSGLGRLEVADKSAFGLGGMSSVRVAAGTWVSLYPATAATPLPVATALVVRCEEAADGLFRLGLKTQRQRAA